MDWDRIYLVDRVVYLALAKSILYPVTPEELHTDIKPEPRENKTVVKGDFQKGFHCPVYERFTILSIRSIKQNCKFLD